MKPYFLFFSFALSFTTVTYAQSNYADFSSENYEEIYSVDFSYDRPYDRSEYDKSGCTAYDVQYGEYIMQSSCSNEYAITNFNRANVFRIEEDLNFEIEASIKFVRGEENNGNCLWWGTQRNGEFRGYGFWFSGNGYYLISKLENQFYNYQSWTKSAAILNYDYNKLTIRKFGNEYYFFINEELVYSRNFEPFFGQEICIQSNQNSTIKVDFLRVSYLNGLGNNIDLGIEESLNASKIEENNTHIKDYEDEITVIDRNINYYLNQINESKNAILNLKKSIEQLKAENQRLATDGSGGTDIEKPNRDITLMGFKLMGSLYKTYSSAVDLYIKKGDPCSINGKLSKFALNETGMENYLSKGRYLIWKMDFKNCDNTTVTRTYSIDLSLFHEEGFNESKDWSFETSEYPLRIYGVRFSDKDDRTLDVLK